MRRRLRDLAAMRVRYGYRRPHILLRRQGWRVNFNALDAWVYRDGVQLAFSRPGKPIDNTFVESFNGQFGDECLNQHWFASLEEVRKTVDAWRLDYNLERPHWALRQQNPAAWEAAWALTQKAPG